MQDGSHDDLSARAPLESRGSDLAASLDRMQSELDRWQTERNRLRTFLHNQQNRQSMLEQQNSRLREEHSRLVDEHSRLSSSITGTPTSGRTALNNSSSNTTAAATAERQEDPSTLSNLANAIAEVGRDNYATRGAAPQRQRLYDWAAPPERSTPGDTNNSVSDEAPRTSAARHRELDRALQNYRVARNALRSDRPSSTDMGAVPTASALRAYWSEESHEENSSTSVNQMRQRRVAQDNIGSSSNSRNPEPSTHPPLNPASGTYLKTRIRNTITYLSALRTTPTSETLELARSFGLDTLYEPSAADLPAPIPNDLPLLTSALPHPQFSSWLVPGMKWHGLQSTERENSYSISAGVRRGLTPGQAAMSSALRRVRQREYIGRAMARRGIVDAQIAAGAMVDREREDGGEEGAAAGGGGGAGSERDGQGSGQAGLDTERYISSLFRDEDGRWVFRTPRPDGSLGAGDDDAANAAMTVTDHWPVTVTIHGVDWEEMEVTGTMKASQIPDHRTGSGEGREGAGRSMESFFKGEIIDFRRHTLETEGKRRGYTDGGVDVDARYWARVGPFKEAIKKAVVVKESGRGPGRGDSGRGLASGPLFAGGQGASGGSDDRWRDEEEKLKILMAEADATAERPWNSKTKTEKERREEREREADRVMSNCVASQKWLSEKLDREWILMRWKGEFCISMPVLCVAICGCSAMAYASVPL
jgi:hypothetical protein